MMIITLHIVAMITCTYVNETPVSMVTLLMVM